MFRCTLAPNRISVRLKYLLGKISSMLKGKTRYGNLSVVCKFISNALKKVPSSEYFLFTFPKVPLKVVSRFSPPLNKFLANKVILGETPKFINSDQDNSAP